MPLARSRGLYEGICGLVKEATKSGELRPVDANRLARMLQATLNGSVLQWTIHREGTLEA